MPPSTILHLDNTVAELRRSPASVEHHHRHHAVVLTKLSLNTRLDRSSRDVIELNVCRIRRCRTFGAWIGWIGKKYDYFLYVASKLPLWSTRVRRQHSPISLLCITMILRVRRNFFEITTFPNSGIRARFYALMLCMSRTQVSCGRYKSYCLPACHTLVRRYCWMKRPGPTIRVCLRETGFTDVLCTQVAGGCQFLQL